MNSAMQVPKALNNRILLNLIARFNVSKPLQSLWKWLVLGLADSGDSTPVNSTRRGF